MGGHGIPAGRRAAGVAVRLLVTTVLVIGGLLAAASPAAAHASLVGSDPVNGSVLDESPPEIRLDFDEEVDADLGGIDVVDAAGQRVDAGRARGVDGDPTAVSASLPDLDDGTYVVVYRVLSADGHPVEGALTFSVGTAAPVDTAGLVADLLDDDGGSGAWLQGLGRFVTYAGLAGLVGGLVFVAWAWPAGASSPLVRRVVRGGWVLTVVGTAGVYLLQGPRASGRPLGDAFDPGLVADVASTRLGQAHLLRLGLLAAAALLAWRPEVVLRRGGQVVGAGLGVAIAFTVAAAGHSGTGRLPLLGLAAGTAHTAAMSVWLGGLVGLGAVVLAGRGTTAVPEAAGRTVGAAANPVDWRVDTTLRFSVLAEWAAAIVLVSGAVQVWRIGGGLGQLVDTRWGRLLIVKLVLVAVVLVLAAVGRRTIEGVGPGGTLRRRVLVELGTATVVLALTAALVATPPTEAASSDAFQRTVVQGDVVADVRMAPVAVGPNELHVVVSVPGGALQPVEAEARMSLPAREDLAPIPVPLDVAGPNHWVSPRLEVPFPGEWELDLRLTPEPGRLVRLTVDIPVDE